MARTATAKVQAPQTMRINDHELPALEHQRRFLNIQTRNPALVGGYGCGKSHILLRKAIQGAAENPGLIGIYACLTYPVLRDAILPELFSVLNSYGLTEGVDWSFNQSSMTLSLPIFSDEDKIPAAVYFRPVEGKGVLSRVVAITAAWACLDEAALMPEEAYRKVSERVRDSRARRPFVAAATTPEGFGWVYEKWVSDPRKRAATVGGGSAWVEDEQFRFVRGRTADNPNLDPDYIDSLLSQYDEVLVKAYLEGFFVPMMTGRCFRFAEHEHVSPAAVYDPMLPIRMAWDFNVNPMSVSLNHYHKGQLWTFDEIVMQSSHTEDVCEEFLAQYGRGGAKVEAEGHLTGVRVYGDASGRARSTKSRHTDYQIIEQLIGQAMPGFEVSVPRTNPSQRESINTLNGLMKNGYGEISYAINGMCPESIKSLLTTVYDDNGSIAKGGDHYEHLTDGLRYIAWDVAPIETTIAKGRKKTTRGRARV